MDPSSNNENMEAEPSTTIHYDFQDTATPAVPENTPEHDGDSLERRLRNETEIIMKNTATQLEGILNDVKGTTKKLLDEIQTYMEVSESVSADYIRCQESQTKEAKRLNTVQPDVEGATNRFLEQQLALMGGGSQESVELEAMLSQGG